MDDLPLFYVYAAAFGSVIPPFRGSRRDRCICCSRVAQKALCWAVDFIAATQLYLAQTLENVKFPSSELRGNLPGPVGGKNICSKGRDTAQIGIATTPR